VENLEAAAAGEEQEKKPVFPPNHLQAA